MRLPSFSKRLTALPEFSNFRFSVTNFRFFAASYTHFQRTGIPVRQIEEKTMEKQRPKTEMVGPEGLEPPTKRL